jgi:hypothetical protein
MQKVNDRCVFNVEEGVGMLEIELWGRLVSLASRVPGDYSNLCRHWNKTSSNFYSPERRPLCF